MEKVTGIKNQVKGLELSLTLDEGGLAQGGLFRTFLTVMAG